MAATTEEVPRPYGRGTSSVVSFVVAMNRVDVVDLVVDLVDVDLDVDLVDVDLDVNRSFDPIPTILLSRKNLKNKIEFRCFRSTL